MDCVHSLHQFVLFLASRLYLEASKILHMVKTIQGPPDDSLHWKEQEWLFKQSLLTAADTHPNAGIYALHIFFL